MTDGVLIRDLERYKLMDQPGEPRVEIADPAALPALLAARLIADAGAAAGAIAGQGDLAGRLADVLEVVHAIAAHAGISGSELDRARTARLAEYGAFRYHHVWRGNEPWDNGRRRG